jgi:hypothetical protein
MFQCIISCLLKVKLVNLEYKEILQNIIHTVYNCIRYMVSIDHERATDEDNFRVEHEHTPDIGRTNPVYDPDEVIDNARRTYRIFNDPINGSEVWGSPISNLVDMYEVITIGVALGWQTSQCIL